MVAVFTDWGTERNWSQCFRGTTVFQIDLYGIDYVPNRHSGILDFGPTFIADTKTVPIPGPVSFDSFGVIQYDLDPVVFHVLPPPPRLVYGYYVEIPGTNTIFFAERFGNAPLSMFSTLTLRLHLSFGPCLIGGGTGSGSGSGGGGGPVLTSCCPNGLPGTLNARFSNISNCFCCDHIGVPITWNLPAYPAQYSGVGYFCGAVAGVRVLMSCYFNGLNWVWLLMVQDISTGRFVESVWDPAISNCVTPTFVFHGTFGTGIDGSGVICPGGLFSVTVGP
jgi:hypothetical protein